MPIFTARGGTVFEGERGQIVRINGTQVSIPLADLREFLVHLEVLRLDEIEILGNEINQMRFRRISRSANGEEG